MDAPAYLAERAQLLDPFLDACVPPPDAPPVRLHAAMRHLLFPGGKRLRPAFAFAACEAIGGAPEHALPIAAAVELVHTYSLVHDDLPCMDDDATRRGRPTVHMAFDESTAVLAGDALQTAAFEVLARAAGSPSAQASVLAACSLDLARATGSRGLAGGQLEDLAFEDGDAAAIASIHERKTAALFAASTAGGARLAGASSDEIRLLHQVGLAIGTAFQVADDLLDRDRDERCSLVAVRGVAHARARAEALLEQALARLAALGDRAEPLRELARHAVRRTR